MSSGDSPSGVIVTGADNGSLAVYDAARIINHDDNIIVMKKDKHQGALKALDFNPFQVVYRELEILLLCVCII